MKIGVDIGGQHVAVGLVENDNLVIDKSELYSAEDREHIEDAIVEKIVREINEILEENNITMDQIESIGIGSPGTISGGSIVKAGNLGLKDFNLLFTKNTKSISAFILCRINKLSCSFTLSV